MDGLSPNTNSPEAVWQEDWHDMQAHVDQLMQHGKVFLAIQFLAGTLFLFVSNYTEDHKMGVQAHAQRELTKVQDYRNTIEEDFDTTNEQTYNPTVCTTAAKGAITAYKDMKKLFTGKGNVLPQTMITNIENEFVSHVPEGGTKAVNGPIFQGDESNPSDLAARWYNLWHQSNTKQPAGAVSSIQPITNGLTAVSSDVSSQSSIVQSKLKYYEANDEQYKAIAHSTQSAYVDQEKQMNQAMQH